MADSLWYPNVWCSGYGSLKEQLHLKALQLRAVPWCVGWMSINAVPSSRVLKLRFKQHEGLTDGTTVPFPESLVELFQLPSAVGSWEYCFNLKRITALIALIFYSCIRGNTDLLRCAAQSWTCTSAFLQIFAVLSQTVPGVWIALSSSLSDINKEENKQAFWIDTQTYLK